MSAISARVATNDEITIKGSVSAPYHCTWTVSKPGDKSLSLPSSTILSDCVLILSTATLKMYAGHPLTVLLTATTGSESTSPSVAWASIDFVPNRAPYGGKVTVTPTEGLELQTVFEIRSSGWVDAEDDLPLMFRFDIDVGDGANPLVLSDWSPQISSWQLRLPCVNRTTLLSQQTLTVVVADSLSSQASAHTSVSIRPWTGPLIFPSETLPRAIMNAFSVASWILNGNLFSPSASPTGRRLESTR